MPIQSASQSLTPLPYNRHNHLSKCESNNMASFHKLGLFFLLLLTDFRIKVNSWLLRLLIPLAPFPICPCHAFLSPTIGPAIVFCSFMPPSSSNSYRSFKSSSSPPGNVPCSSLKALPLFTLISYRSHCMAKVHQPKPPGTHLQPKLGLSTCSKSRSDAR